MDESTSCFTNVSVRENQQVPTTTQEEKDEIAEAEVKVVWRLRTLVLVSLLASAMASSFGVLYYLRSSETAEFEDSFNSDAGTLLQTIGTVMDNTLGATDAFIVKLVSYAKASNSSWPYVTMPFFALHATKVLKLSQGIHLGMKHIVYEQQRETWETYSEQEHGWIQDSLDIQEQLDDWRIPIVRDFNTTGGIVTPFGTPIEKPFPYYNNSYLPLWQQAPIITGPGNPVPFNADIFALPQNAPGSLLTITSKKVTMGDTFWGIIANFSDPYELYVQKLYSDWGSNFIPPDERPDEPSFQLNFPVIDAVDSVTVDIEDDNLEVVGVMTITYYFRSFLRDILPPKTSGVIVVVENTCGNQVFSYLLDGPTTQYLGQEDFHDENYDYLLHSVTISDLLEVTKEDSPYTGVPFESETCPKTLNIYASKEYEDGFRTIKPALFTCITIFIFIFTSSIFIFYDWYVGRRQRSLANRAKVSGAIVASLFPEAYHDRLMQANRVSMEEVPRENILRNFLERNESKAEVGLAGENMDPIADLYLNCTVLFGDIVGFTGWSSTRSPNEVFTLLQTLFGAFDEVARTRGVFKVETIGDCYMAVTGLPQKQPDHAVIMAKFAMECMGKIDDVTGNLVGRLGQGTEKLSLRMGLHSGPVTAGILKGEKSRFQLFGDTVNSASRMESTGRPHHIQVSTETAMLLRNAGKEHWLKARAELIEAKGKGKLQNYWLIGRQTAPKGTHPVEDPAPTPPVASHPKKKVTIFDQTEGIFDDSVSAHV